MAVLLAYGLAPDIGQGLMGVKAPLLVPEAEDRASFSLPLAKAARTP